MNLIAVLSLILAIHVQGQGKDAKVTCTRQDAIRAETEASSLKTWDEVYSSYKKFAQCDDAAIGEGYSSSVAGLLSDNWRSVGQLDVLVSQDRSFEAFVLRHVDELMSPTEAKKIRNNANTHCPSHAKRLCRSIAARTETLSAAPVSKQK